jgi:hypothetical protein
MGGAEIAVKGVDSGAAILLHALGVARSCEFVAVIATPELIADAAAFAVGMGVRRAAHTVARPRSAASLALQIASAAPNRAILPKPVSFTSAILELIWSRVRATGFALVRKRAKATDTLWVA